MATQTQAAGMLANMMFDKSSPNEKKEKSEEETLPQNIDRSEKQNKRFTQIENRIHNMDKSKKEKDNFDGHLDELIDVKGRDKDHE